MLLLNVEQMYTNDKACQNFIGEIGDGNGGCEKSDSEKEVIRVKLIEYGLLVTKLLGITELGQSNAEGIHAAITDKCREMHRELSRSQAGIANANTFTIANTEGWSHHVDGWLVYDEERSRESRRGLQHNKCHKPAWTHQHYVCEHRSS